MLLWVRTIATRATAALVLLLCLFAPPLISLSAEIRQYALLLLFCACCLYFLECALQANPIPCMLLSAFSLYLAILTHYSALIFAAAVGLYAIFRLLQNKSRPILIIVWIIGQIGALAICAFLFESQISKLQQSGLPSEIASTWMRTSIFHAGQDHALAFAWSKSLRLFRYFFSNGTVGFLGFLLFLCGIAFLLWSVRRNFRGSERAVALLLLLPFLIGLGTAFAGIYPYGGTRHDVLLSLLAFTGIAIGLDRLSTKLGRHSKWLPFALVACALVIGNLFPSPTGPYIRPKNQARQFMQSAIGSLHSLTPEAIIFTDAQGSMVLNYYLCGENLALAFAPGTESQQLFQCGSHPVLTLNTAAGFDRADFPRQLAHAWEGIPGTATLYLFQSGWIDDREQDWLAELRQQGGTPQNFGPNILICELRRIVQPNND
jgi:hypothetical protein